ncbi:hypothetical protein KSF78_0009365 [Schistosoma japonicum]|nr:hypothetical protein KSF78_0009365 [Schistosoma japonicum]
MNRTNLVWLLSSLTIILIVSLLFSLAIYNVVSKRPSFNADEGNIIPTNNLPVEEPNLKETTKKKFCCT